MIGYNLETHQRLEGYRLAAKDRLARWVALTARPLARSGGTGGGTAYGFGAAFVTRETSAKRGYSLRRAVMGSSLLAR